MKRTNLCRLAGVSIVGPSLLITSAHLLAEPPVSPADNLPAMVTVKSTVRVWVDQIGYRPLGKKLLIVASDQKLPDGLDLEVCEAASGKGVWKLSQHAEALKPFNAENKDKESGDYVSHLDISDLKSPGRYYVAIHNGSAPVERSYQFNIAANVYEASAVASWRMFYYNRCDIEKPEKYAGVWGAKLDHHGPGQATEAREYKWTGGAWFDAVGKEVADPAPRDVTGGWWDAGDFNKYMGNMSSAHNDLLLATQILGDSIKDKQLNIPESGNGVPDPLDESRFGTELILKMADETGAAYGRVHETPTCPPDLDKSPVQLTARTSGATMNRSADLAYAAVVWDERKLDPAFAKKCLDASLLSWKLLDEKPHPWPVSAKDPKKEAGTGDWFEEDYTRSRTIAAVCLFRLTKDAQYDKVVHELATKMSGDRDYWGAYWVYMHTPGADAELVTKMKGLILSAADKAAARTGEHRGYAAGNDGYWWGSNRAFGEAGLACCLAAELSDDAAVKQKYLDAAEEYIHYLHGRNPLGMCYLTNMKQFGAEHSVVVMFHSWYGNPSKQNDPFGSKYIGEGPGKIGPPPGYVVGGANGGMKKYNNTLNGSCWEHNEPDITYQSPCCGLLGYFGWKVR